MCRPFAGGDPVSGGYSYDKSAMFIVLSRAPPGIVWCLERCRAL
jgi:hypothetical protein